MTARPSEGQPGAAYVICGQSGTGRGTLDPGALSATQGFTIVGAEGNAQAGRSVAAAGDVNGDGIDDLIIGARFGDSGPFNSGEAYVVFGVAGTSRGDVDLAGVASRPTQGFVIAGANEDDNAG